MHLGIPCDLKEKLFVRKMFVLKRKYWEAVRLKCPSWIIKSIDISLTCCMVIKQVFIPRYVSFDKDGMEVQEYIGLINYAL